ncbi:uncharacterized protein [Montipora capricornis]|uniref:uncharacterized protein n=1 Tax=Montipora capricornis TaxID=246305 RepID=UPI0035F169FE
MASSTTGFPSWLLLSKEDIVKSNEWKDLTSELFDALKQQLTESRVSYFSDLTDSEKILFLDRAARLVRNGSSYKSLLLRVSGVLDRNLNEDVVKTLVDPSNKYTKTQLLLEQASEASIKFLQRWPDLRIKLYACINHPLPKNLRKAVWKMCLADPNVRREFLDRVLKNKRDTGSAHDASIGQKCHAFLSSEAALRELSSARPAVVDVMISALSYRQYSTKGVSTLVDTDFLLTLPFLKTMVLDIDVNHVDSEEVANFVEMYCTFMDSRPPLMKDSRSKEFLSALKQYGSRMASILESKDHQLALSLQRILLQDKAGQMAESLAALMRPCARCMFVGFLSLDVVCYIWDQFILSIRLRSFHCIAMFSSVMLMLLREPLLRCRNVREVEDVLLLESKKLNVRDFQRLIDHHFMEDWRKEIKQEIHETELPLVDPVATVGGSVQPWAMWFHDQPPNRQRVEDRQQTREEREEERRRKLMEQQREEARRKREEEEQIRRREQEMRRKFQIEKRKESEQIAALEIELKRERTQRASAEKRKDEVIARLQAELARYRAPSAHTPASIPPSSNHSVPSVREPTQMEPTSQPSISPRQDAQELLRDLLRGTLRSLDLVGHGPNEQRTHLDIMTRKALVTNSQDYKQAEMELFGRELDTEDWDTMEEEERSEKTGRLVTRIKEKRKERFNETESQ